MESGVVARREPAGMEVPIPPPGNERLFPFDAAAPPWVRRRIFRCQCMAMVNASPAYFAPRPPSGKQPCAPLPVCPGRHPTGSSRGGRGEGGTIYRLDFHGILEYRPSHSEVRRSRASYEFPVSEPFAAGSGTFDCEVKTHFDDWS